MTCTVKLPDGGIDEYMKQDDGSLDVIRTGAKVADSYASGAWTGVEGDEKKWKKHHLFG